MRTSRPSSRATSSRETPPRRRADGAGRRRRKTLARAALALLLLAAASLHFLAAEMEERLVPSWLPWRRQLVYVSGIAEMMGALGLLAPSARLRRAAGWWIVLVFVAVFPVNVNHAVNNLQVGGLLDSRVYQWARLPFQAVFIWWALWCTAPQPAATPIRAGAERTVGNDRRR